MIATVNNMRDFSEWVNFLECFAMEHKYPIYRTEGAILISDPKNLIRIEILYPELEAGEI